MCMHGSRVPLALPCFPTLHGRLAGFGGQPEGWIVLFSTSGARPELDSIFRSTSGVGPGFDHVLVSR